MKTFLTFLFFFGMMILGQAQDKWKVYHNSVLQLKSAEEVPEKNGFGLRIAALNKEGALSIVYTEAPKQKDWKRTIMFVDESNNEVLRKAGFSVKIGNTVLKSLFKKTKTLQVYTISLPADPAKAALVRVRRVHLATITLTR
jgi:hypothetical protein